MKKTFTFITFLLTAAVSYAQPQLNKSNIDEVIGAMTLEEKVFLLVGGTENADIEGMPETLPSPVPGTAGITRAIPRLGIPATVLSDGPAGARVNPADENAEITFPGCHRFGNSLAVNGIIGTLGTVCTEIDYLIPFFAQMCDHFFLHRNRHMVVSDCNFHK